MGCRGTRRRVRTRRRSRLRRPAPTPRQTAPATRDTPRSWRPIYANPELRVGTYGTRSLRGSHQQEDESMLKRILATTAVLGLCALPLAAQGHAATAGNEMTITGQVVDLNCFTTNGASGAGHKACAQACAKAGVPLGVLSSDGTIYVPVSSKPGDPQNSKLEQLAES